MYRNLIMKPYFYSSMALAAVAFSLSMAAAVEDVPMKVTKAAVFKNGYSQISMAGRIPGNDTKLRVLDMPVPVLGSFWWDSSDNVSVREVRSESAAVQVPAERFTPLDFLLANPGKEADVVLSNGTHLTGVICVPSAETAESSFRRCHYTAPKKGMSHHSRESDVVSRDVAHNISIPGTAAVLLRTPGGMVPLQEKHILYAELKCDSPQYPTTEKKLPALVFDLNAPAEGGTLQVSSLSLGLSWLPSYRLELENDGKAHFQCKVMVMNELVDLNNVQLELVMGYPALGKHLLPSPVAQYYSLDDFLKLISDAPSRREVLGLSSNFVSNNNANYVSHAQNDSCNLTQAEDLFFYSVPNFSCAAGQTVTRGIFEGTVHYSHVYSWNVPTQSSIEQWQRDRRNDYDSHASSPHEVWHCVRVHNSLNTPWTGGVLDCYAEGRFVGRSDITFTPAGGASLVRLNKTMQTPVQYTETLVSREADVMTLEGKLSLTNQQEKVIDVIITKEVNGTPLSASNGAVTTCTPAYGDNPNGKFRWELRVQPGETATVTYRYNHKN